jgi:cation:H+ antiporter
MGDRVALSFITFFVAACVSLSTSWLLVTRLERVGERLGMTEALLGVLAALAANAPEITTAVSALAQHQRSIGAGVVIGSNVFNLAALLGVSAVVSGFVSLHRRVVVLSGAVALWVALCCLLASTSVLGAPWALAAAGVVLVGYVAVLAAQRPTRHRVPLPTRVTAWLVAAIDEEEIELNEAIRPPRGRPLDAVVAAIALVVVVVASVVMEHTASRLGHHFHVADAIVGALILAAVTSLPNAVAAVHLATQGRGAAALSTAVNSNNINVVAGLLIPGTILGLARASGAGTLTAASYLTLTLAVVLLAYRRRGLSRRAGWLILAGYAAFVVALVATT